jgi:ribosomal-protein-alanine N-acetyltransferase
MDIAVSGNFRGQGLGKLLLEKLIEVAYIKKLRAMTLEVRRSNFKAINLYEKYDFKLAGARPKYYENTEDALIYWKTL